MSADVPPTLYTPSAKLSIIPVNIDEVDLTVAPSGTFISNSNDATPFGIPAYDTFTTFSSSVLAAVSNVRFIPLSTAGASGIGVAGASVAFGALNTTDVAGIEPASRSTPTPSSSATFVPFCNVTT